MSCNFAICLNIFIIKCKGKEWTTIYVEGSIKTFFCLMWFLGCRRMERSFAGEWAQSRQICREHYHSMDMSLSKLGEVVKDREAWRSAVQGLQRVGHDLATE